MSRLPFFRRRTHTGGEPDTTCQLAALREALAGYLSGKTEDLAAAAERLAGLYGARRLDDALELQRTMTEQTAELTTLAHIADGLDAFMASSPPSPTTPTYIISSLFLAGLINRLLPAEKMALLTGAKLGDTLFTVDTGVPLQAQASATHVSPTAESRAAAINYCWQGGCTLHVIAHTHPGTGPQAVWPSAVDIGTLARLQKSRFPIIGLVACEGGYFRVYSDNRPFTLQVVGEGVELLDAGSHLYRVNPELLAQADQLDVFVSPLAVRAV